MKCFAEYKHLSANPPDRAPYRSSPLYGLRRPPLIPVRIQDETIPDAKHRDPL